MLTILPSRRAFNLCIKKLLLLVCLPASYTAFAGQVKLHVTSQYLNVPIGRNTEMKEVQLQVAGVTQLEFPAQLAEDTISYWIFIDVSAYRGQTVTLSSQASNHALSRIYQANTINGADSLYRETNRPQFHFTVKRGWSNDINGPIYYNGQYHLFWQYFPFGLEWNTGFMYWGHATSPDLLHWKDVGKALMLDSLGSPWSGTAVIDKNNDGGWGKNALVLYYACFNRHTNKQVQCIAYSTDNGKTFKHYASNPVIDSNDELKTNDTRDPKVFWYQPTNTWVMVLFEKDGMSFYNSADMRHWQRQSHFAGLWECPDFFELPVTGNPTLKKWVLHGGSSEYFIGSFDGKTFTPESPKLDYAEGQNAEGNDVLYAAESFENMPNGRRVQMAWGRVSHQGMPFTQMMLFPTEFALTSTPEGLRLTATPIREIAQLHKTSYTWRGQTAAQANTVLHNIKAGPLHIKLTLAPGQGHSLRLLYQGNQLLTLQPGYLTTGENNLEILIDKTVAEIFINQGRHYILKTLQPKNNEKGFEVATETTEPVFTALQVHEMQSIWPTAK
jgi:fructan beta-fructosidase